MNANHFRLHHFSKAMHMNFGEFYSSKTTP